MSNANEFASPPNPAATFLLGALVGAGAGLVVGFLTSPQRGSTTRNLLANQMRHYVAEARKAARRAESKGRDLRNRATGFVHELRTAAANAATSAGMPTT